MDIGKYKQAMSYLLNSNATLKTFALNPNAKLSDNDPQPIFGFETGGRVMFKTGGDVQKWVQENYPEVKLDFKKHPKMGLGTLDKDYSMIRSAITKKLNNPNYVKPSLDIYINKIADAFLKADAKDDISYLASKNKFNKNGVLSNAEISFLSRKINSPTFVQDIVDKTGLKAEQILDMLDERENFIELDLIPEMATRNKQLGSQEMNKRISQGEDWLIKNSKNYNSVKDLKRGFTRVLGKDHPFLKQTLKTSYGMPKLNPLFFEEKEKTYQTRGNRAFMYGEPDMKNLFEASLYNFNPTVRDKVLNELNDILPKTKIDENKKYDLRKKFQDSKVLSEFGINKGLKGPVTRLLIKDLGDDVINNINFIRYPRTEVGHYINYLKDKVAPKYRKQFNLVNDALNDIKKNNYNGAKQKLNIAENINFDHRVPKYLIDAGYADELEYIKLNPVGEKFNQVAKNKSFDGPMARLSRQYEATDIPEDKAKIVKKMNDLKDNFNKRYNNYLSDINIKEVEGKLNVSSSAKPITSSDELIKTLETNVKENPQFFKLEEVYDKADVTKRAAKGEARLYADPTGIGNVLETSFGKALMEKAPSFVNALGKVAKATGAEFNALLGVALNSDELKELGFSDLETIGKAAYKGMTEDLANFGSMIYSAVAEAPFSEKPYFETVLEAGDRFKFAREDAKEDAEKMSTKERVDKIAEYRARKKFQQDYSESGYNPPTKEEFQKIMELEKEGIFKEGLFSKKLYYEEEPKVNPLDKNIPTIFGNVPREEEQFNFAKGGRVGYAGGSEDPNKLIPIDPLLQDQSPTDPGRRDILKLGVTGAGLLGLGKLGLLKLGSVAKPSIIAEAVKGTTAPSWMEGLMTKILAEGTEIKMPKESSIIKKEVKFKNPETGDVQTATLTIDPKSDRMIIEYNSPTNVADQPVSLELYRERKSVTRPDGKSFYLVPDKTKGYRFATTESGPRVTDWDGNIEFDAEDTYYKIIDLKSDISGLKSYATEGKGINKKVAQEKRAATKDVEENPHEYVPDNYPDTKYWPND